ncbi:MAG: methylated-DNA--[protein]-cysteine S-methyltransferase [Methylobacter sp.]
MSCSVQTSAFIGKTGVQPSGCGANTRIRFAIGQCPLDSILVAAGERGIRAIALADNPENLKRDLYDKFPQAELIDAQPDLETLIAKLAAFIETPALGLDVTLDIRGTAFQQRVWQALREISVGTTASYSEIARRIGTPNAVRAVAGACAANNLAVAIPCHRVVGTDGRLSGYRWGIQRKAELLRREKQTS